MGDVMLYSYLNSIRHLRLSYDTSNSTRDTGSCLCLIEQSPSYEIPVVWVSFLYARFRSYGRSCRHCSRNSPVVSRHEAVLAVSIR